MLHIDTLTQLDWALMNITVRKKKNETKRKQSVLSQKSSDFSWNFIGIKSIPTWAKFLYFAFIYFPSKMKLFLNILKTTCRYL